MLARLIAGLLFTALAVLPARALTVTATPTTAYVQGTGTALITIRWTLVFNVTAPTQTTVFSTNGVLVAGAQPPQMVGGPLQRTIRLDAGQTVVRITERLRIDRTSARHILEAGQGTFARDFQDTIDGADTFTVSLEGRASGSGGLTLQGFDLAFDDGSDFATIGQDGALSARARLATSGRGLIEGKWEIAGPDGGFRLLRRVRVFAGGPTRSAFESPALPTAVPGQYQLRFVPDGNGQGPVGPVITYVVTGGAAPAAITLTAPADGAAISADMRFSWSTVKGAARYRIEFLEDAGGAVRAAVEVKEAGAVIRSFTLERLRTSGAAVWQVVALNEAGAVIARSAARALGRP